MQLKNYTDENFKKLQVVYAPDGSTTLNNKTLFSDENMHFSQSAILSSVGDVKINNFSELFLSKRKKLSDFFTIDPLASIPEAFSTFFAFDGIQEVGPRSYYWQADDTATLLNNSASLTITQASSLVNANFFDIVFLDQMLCKVSHEHDGLTRFLTVDYSFNLNLAVDTGLDALGPSSPQIFYYFQDEENDLIVLYKQILDFPYYVTFNPYTGKCSLRQPPTGPYFPFNMNGVMRMRPRTPSVNTLNIDDFEAVYTGDTRANSLNTNEAASQQRKIGNNNLVTAQYSTVSGDTLDVNVLTLKNELAPQNNNVRLGGYFATDAFSVRQYNKIFSGTHQVFGNDSITMGFDGHTQLLQFASDKISYFHVPYDIFPFTQLNINDAQLGSCGAIAGDHPVKADKIFKKRAAYGSYDAFGQASDEANGEFLCAWLSASPSLSSAPIWVDRYYNPSRVSFIEALTSRNLTDFTSNASTIIESLSTTSIIFDKPSDLFFEPGVFYAYHHLGKTDITNYLETLTDVLVQAGLTNYYVRNTQLYGQTAEVDEFVFDGQQYSVSNSLSSITDSNRFTIAFDMWCSNWNTSFANQIIGNYITDGTGLFVDNYITPFLYYFLKKSLYIYGTNTKLLQTLTFDADIRSVWRKENLKDYYVVLNSGDIIQQTAAGTVDSAAICTVSGITEVTNTFYTSTSAALLVKTPTTRKAITFDFATNNYTEATSVTMLNNGPISGAQSIALYNSQVFCTSSFTTHVRDNSMYYLSEPYEVRKWDLDTTTDYPMFTASIPIRDFNIDKNDNFWILFDDFVMKYTSTRQFVLSAPLSVNTFNSVNINFVNEITPTGNEYYTLITAQQFGSGGFDDSLTLTKMTPEGSIFYTTNIAENFGFPLTNQNITNDDFNSREVITQYRANTLNSKLVATNAINTTQREFNLFFPLSALDPGYHHIAMRFDSLQGAYGLFIDGLKVDETLFDPGQYIFSNTLERPFIVGATPFYNNQTLAQHLNNTLYYVTQSKIKNLKIFNEAILDADIRLLATATRDIPDVVFNMPAGKRAFLDEIERVFTLDVPNKKANSVNIRIKNMGNISAELQALLETRILERVKGLIPINSSVRAIKWVN